MRRLVLKGFVFLFLIYLIDKPVGIFISNLTQKKQVDNRIELLFTDKINHDLIVLGSSRAVNGISCGTLQENTNQTCYNLGYSGSNLAFHKSIFELLIANQTPKIILLSLDEAATFTENEKIIYRKDKLVPFLENDLVLRKYTDHSKKNYWGSKISWAYRENQNVFSAIKYIKDGKDLPEETTGINQYGSILLSDSVAHFENEDKKAELKYYDSSNESTALIESLNYIMNESKKLGIKFYLLRMPKYQNNLLGFNERVNEIIKNKDIPYLDFSNIGYSKKYFFDNGHLNKNGAIKFSEMLSNHIN